MKATGKYSDKLAELLYSGSILKAYGKKTLLNVQPELGIGLVRFSIVGLETGGKDHLDIYLQLESVRQFVADIDSGMAARKIAEDTKSDYPEAYKWVTGENGSKSLAIGRGKSGIVANIKINGEQKDGNQTRYKMAVLQGRDIKQFAFLFKLVTGILPVSNSSYYGRLIRIFYEGIADRNRMYAGSTARNAEDQQRAGHYQEPAESFPSDGQQDFRRNTPPDTLCKGNFYIAN